MSEEIQVEDDISRCIIFNQFFREGIHINEMLFQFLGKRSEDGKFHESGVLRRLAPASTDVHLIGCGIAKIQNDSRGNPEPGNGRKYYCGFRTARAGSLPQKDDGYELTVRNIEEFGVKAHVDFALEVFGDSKSERATNRTAAGLAIAEKFGGVEPFLCEADRNDAKHPFQLYGVECLGRVSSNGVATVGLN